MKDLMMRAIDLATRRGAQYADARVVRTTNERISVKNGVVDSLNRSESGGFGVRVRVDGAWGFASSRDLGSSEFERITDLALQIARASALVTNAESAARELGPPVSSQGSYTTPIKIDPLEVSVDLAKASNELNRNEASYGS